MLALATSHSMSPYEQLEVCFSVIPSILKSLTEKTDAAFDRVHVVHANNNDKSKGFLHSYIEHIPTGKIYYDERESVVALKCVLVAMGMPVYAFVRMACYYTKLLLEVTLLALDTLAKFSKAFLSCRFSESFWALRSGITAISCAAAESLFEIIKAPLFLVAAEFVTLMGVIKPYHSRMYEALLEEAWQQGDFYENDSSIPPPQRIGWEGLIKDIRAMRRKGWEAFIQNVRFVRPKYLAPCFQPIGNVDIKNSPIHIVDRKSLS